MDLQIKDQKAFVSGSTAGIGYGIAKRLLMEGAQVIINGRTQAGVDQAVAELKSATGNVQISGITADFAKAEEVNRLIAQLPDLDILINNAGIFEPKAFEAIPVNAILPGPTRSRGINDFIGDLSRTTDTSSDEVEKDFFKNMRPNSIIQRFASVEEIADTTVYYCSPLASATNGAAIRVEGGLIKTIF